MNLAWILPCRARWLLHKPTVSQALSMLRETPATPYAGMTIFCGEHPAISYSSNLPLKNAAFVVRYNSFFYSSF
jgi:hypothetical protein